MGTTSDLSLLRRKLAASDYSPDLYVKEIASRCVGGHELILQRKNIQVAAAAAAAAAGSLGTEGLIKIKFLVADFVGGHALPAQEECLPELRPVYRDGQGDLLPRVGDVPTVPHDHRAKESAPESGRNVHTRGQGQSVSQLFPFYLKD